jgi:Secretion system C-terminal sorting domain
MMRRVLFFFFVMLVASAAYATTIHDIQYCDDPGADDASPMLGETVTVTGFVTFEPMSNGGNNFYIADAAGSWNGINVYTGGETYNFGFGWEIEVTGTVDEYNNLTEIVASAPGAITVLEDRYDMAGFWEDLHANPGNYPELAYTVVDASMLSAASDAEQYEGVLVRLEDVTVESLPGDFGEWSVNDGQGNVVAIDDPTDEDFGYMHIVTEGQHYDRLQGILNFSYDEYKIRPEIAFDLKGTIDQPNGYFTQVGYFQQVRPMDMTVREFEEEFRTWDHSYASNVRYGLFQGPGDYGEDIIMHAVVTYPTELGYAGEGAKFIMTDWLVGDTHLPWMSVLSYTPDPANLGTLEIGDEVIFYGQVGEYSTGPSNMTEVWITDDYEFFSFNNPVPAAAIVDVAELHEAITCEKWGNVFVTVLNSVLVNDGLQYELFGIDDNLNDDYPYLAIDDDSAAMDEFEIPPLGTSIESITGWMYHHYGVLETDDWVYKLCPSYPEDIVVGAGPPTILTVTRDSATPAPNQPVVIAASISDDSSVESATVHYSYNGTDWDSGEMDYLGGIDYEFEIDGAAEGTFVHYYVQAEDDEANVSTFPSDIESEWLGYFADSDPGLYEIQWTPWPSGRSAYDNYTIGSITGVVTTNLINAQTYDEPENYYPYFMQVEGPGPYRGILIQLEQIVNQGDEITIVGATVNEEGIDSEGIGWTFKWGGSTRMINPVLVTVNSTGNDFNIFEPTVEDVNADPEAWESVMVNFSDVTITSVNSYDWEFEDASGSALLVDDDMVLTDDGDPGDPAAMAIFDELVNGTYISSLTGPLTYSFGTWKIEIRAADDFGTVGVDDDLVEQPLTFSLAPVYPNPFNPTTTINFSVPWSGDVKLVVYNTMGQRVETLINDQLQAGRHNIVWNGQNVASGTYFLRLTSNRQQHVQKMVLLK